MQLFQTSQLSPTVRQKIVSFLLTDLTENVLLLLCLFGKTDAEGQWYIYGGEERNPVIGVMLEIEVHGDLIRQISGRFPIETLETLLDQNINQNLLIHPKMRKKLSAKFSDYSEHSYRTYAGMVFENTPLNLSQIKKYQSSEDFFVGPYIDADQSRIKSFYHNFTPMFFELAVKEPETYYVIKDRNEIIAAAAVLATIPELSLAILGNFLTLAGYRNMDLAKLLASNIIARLQPAVNRVVTIIDSHHAPANRMFTRLRFKHMSEIFYVRLRDTKDAT